MTFSGIAFFLIGLILGMLGVWLWTRRTIGEAINDGKVTVATLEERINQLNQNATESRQQLEQAQESGRSMAQQLKNAEQGVAVLEQKLKDDKDKLSFMATATQELSDRFKTLASEVLEQKSANFETHSKALLQPLERQIEDFRKKVETVYDTESADRNQLKGQVGEMMRLNESLRQEANNLTLALKGNAKVRGNLGEHILATVLQRTGLIKDEHYFLQRSHQTEVGRQITDAEILLPGGRYLIVDAKFTLPDHTLYEDAGNEEVYKKALSSFNDSVGRHIESLVKVSYQKIYGQGGPDFVVMFIPLEAAFLHAVSHEANLFERAWKSNVLLAGPSTLLFVVRTVAHLWRQQKLHDNVMEISRLGGTIYDKLVGFVEDFDKVDKNLKLAQSSFDEANKKLRSGKGNALSQTEKLRQYGVKPQKSLPQSSEHDFSIDIPSTN